jgi:hypothetical protein
MGGVELEAWLLGGCAVVGGQLGGYYLVEGWDARFEDAWKS